jgi:hypothetical protein
MRGLALVDERTRQRIGRARREHRIGRSVSHVDQMTVRNARDRHASEERFHLARAPARFGADGRLRRRRSTDEERDLLDEARAQRGDGRRHALSLGRRRAHPELLDRAPDDDPALHEARLRLVEGVVSGAAGRSDSGFTRIGLDKQLSRRFEDRRLPKAGGRPVGRHDEKGEQHRPAAPVHDAQVIPGNAASNSHTPRFDHELGRSSLSVRATAVPGPRFGGTALHWADSRRPGEASRPIRGGAHGLVIGN